MSSSNERDSLPNIMQFQPTYEEFKNFSQYIKYMESRGAHLAGVAKIIPPPEWIPRKSGYNIDDINMSIPTPILQTAQGQQGQYQVYNETHRSMTVRQFKEKAESSRYETPKHFDYKELERKFWRNVSYISPLYAADVKGTLTDADLTVWNINKLDSILNYVSKDYCIEIDGVNTAYLYFGMWKSAFAWHTEDMELYSINYLHFGAPKTWYAIPPAFGRKFEQLACRLFPNQHKECAAFLRHKMTLISPHILRNNKIPLNRLTQEPGEIMITFPFGYHAGFNHGFNAAESTNFASERWIEYGKRSAACKCRKDMVRISMETFVKRFQPDKYENWLKGCDYGSHPEEPGKICAAPPPTLNKYRNKRTNSSDSESDAQKMAQKRGCAFPSTHENDAANGNAASTSRLADTKIRRISGKNVDFNATVVVRLHNILSQKSCAEKTGENLLTNGICKNTKRMRFHTKTVTLDDEE